MLVVSVPPSKRSTTVWTILSLLNVEVGSSLVCRVDSQEDYEVDNARHFMGHVEIVIIW